jgi:hypothetical protein
MAYESDANPIKLPWASGCWPMIRTALKSTSPFSLANRTAKSQGSTCLQRRRQLP